MLIGLCFLLFISGDWSHWMLQSLPLLLLSASIIVTLTHSHTISHIGRSTVSHCILSIRSVCFDNFLMSHGAKASFLAYAIIGTCSCWEMQQLGWLALTWPSEREFPHCAKSVMCKWNWQLWVGDRMVLWNYENYIVIPLVIIIFGHWSLILQGS